MSAERAGNPPPAAPKWWKEATCYQIWPASYKDSDGDGIGDLGGITSTLDYLHDLGIDCLWLSPVYDSPQADMGYDVADYEAIWPTYGTLHDMDLLIAEAKKREMKIVMDLVINHSSSQHRWFSESRQSTSNPRSDWYIWRDPKYDTNGERHEPCNWKAAFGGSVWEFDPLRQQYYLHLGLPGQPDFNWQNAETREAIYRSAVDFWLKRGIDGFRMDVVNFYWKDPAFPDATVKDARERYQAMEPQHIMNGPAVHAWLKELRTKIRHDHGDEIVLIGELPGTDTEEVLKYISPSSGELDMIFDFDIFMAGNDWNAKMHEMKLPTLAAIKQTLVKTQGFLDYGSDAWTTAFLENHDNSRSVSRLGPGEGEHRENAAKMLALFLTTMSGTLFIYQGQEIGMTNVQSSWKREDFRDAATLRYLDELEHTSQGNATTMSKGLEAARTFGRDNARTPVQWSAQPYAGFSTVQPWIPINENFHSINVAEQVARPTSALGFWRKALRTRKQHKDLFIHSRFELIDTQDESLCAYLNTCRSNLDRRMLVVLNFSDQAKRFMPPSSMKSATWELITRTVKDNDDLDVGMWTLRPWEGRAYFGS